MNDNFPSAYKFMRGHEGGFADDPNDHGGATKWGISLAFLEDVKADINGDGAINRQDIVDLTEEDVRKLYYKYFWSANKLDWLYNASVAIKAFDLFVNMGTRQASLVLQRAARCCGAHIKEDGIIGPITRTTINTITASNGDEWKFIAAVRSEAAGVYRMIAQANKSQRKFLNGWLNRAYS